MIKILYYTSDGKFKKYDLLTEHNLNKYFALSKDNPDMYCHTPDKTLLIILHLKEKEPGYKYKNSDEYASYYKDVICDSDLISYSTKFSDSQFDNSVILNYYQKFIERTYYIVHGKQK